MILSSVPDWTTVHVDTKRGTLTELELRSRTQASAEDLVEANRGMLPIFRSSGMKINYVESPDGHSWESWRDHLGPGLCWLFPSDSRG
jgi:enterochelin esterase-like enzyme